MRTILRLFQEKEYDLTEEFHFDGEEVRHVNKLSSHSGQDDKYNYYHVEKDSNAADNSIVQFVPAPEDVNSESDDETDDEEEAELPGQDEKEDEEILSNEIPALHPSRSSSSAPPHHRRRHHGHHGSALRQAHIKSFRGNSGGYHASTGPQTSSRRSTRPRYSR